MKKEIFLLTGNQGKIDAANLIFNKFGITVSPLDLDIPEIQSSTSAEIAMAMALEAYKTTNKPVIREDHSFYIDELGFPGPFMAYADKTISAEQLLKIVDTLSSRKAHFELAAAYIDEHGEAHSFQYSVPVKIANEVRGTDKLHWERLMMLEGDNRTFAEFSSDDRAELWTKNYEEIAKLIQHAA